MDTPNILACALTLFFILQTPKFEIKIKNNIMMRYIVADQLTIPVADVQVKGRQFPSNYCDYKSISIERFVNLSRDLKRKFI